MESHELTPIAYIARQILNRCPQTTDFDSGKPRLHAPPLEVLIEVLTTELHNVLQTHDIGSRYEDPEYAGQMIFDYLSNTDSDPSEWGAAVEEKERQMKRED